MHILLFLLLILSPGPLWAASIPFQTDKTGFTEGSGGVQVLGACVNDTRGGNIAEDNVGCLRATNQGDLHMSPYDSGGTAISDTTAHAIKTLSVDTTGAAIVPSTVVTDAATLTRGQTNVILGDVAIFADNGASYVRLQADGSNNLKVNCISGCTASSISDATATGSLAALNNTVSVAMVGDNGAAVEFASGTLGGSTVIPEISTDGGTTWSAAVFQDPISGAVSTSLTNPSAAQYGIGWAIGGVSHVRVRVSVFGSGAVTANVRATITRPYSVHYGSDGTNIRALATTTGGLMKVDLSGTAANGTAVKVDGSAVTQPVSMATAPALVASSAIIGKVGIDQTTPGTTNGVQVNAALPTGTNTIGNIGWDRPTTDPYTEASINFTATGDNTIVSATAAQTTRVFRMFFVVSAATNITIKDGATGLTGAMSFPANGSYVLDLSNAPWFTTSTNTAFIINQSGTAQISGRIYYVKS